MKDYNEILLTAIDTVVAQRLSELQFDETIICTIVDDSDKKNGHYRVTDGSITFDAYTETTHYYNDAQVYVTIPKGDWTARKLITGRYTGDEDNQPITYVSPLEKVAQLTENLANGFDGAEVAANCSYSYDSKGNPIVGAFIKEIGSVETPINTLINDTLCIQADFKCLLDSYDMESGAYGLMVKAFDENDKEIATFMLDSSRDMFGRPYAYTAWAAQQQAYKFNSSIGTIERLVWYLYQDGSFYYDNGTDDILIPVNKISNNEVQSNIFVRNIQIFFGTDVSQVEDNTVKIVTNSSLKYQGKEDTKKDIELIWYNKGEGNKFLGFKDGEFDKDKAMNQEIWTQEEVDKIEDDKPIAGSSKYPIEAGKNYYWIEWYLDNTDGAFELLSEGNEEQIKKSIDCLPELTMTEIQAIVWLNKTKYASNVIQFINQTDQANLVANKDVTISIENKDNSQDVYPLYGEDNKLINTANRSERTICLKSHWSKGFLTPAYWKGATIRWYIPTNMTMLKPPYDWGGSGFTKETDYYIYKIEIGEKPEDLSTYACSYCINDVYHDNYINNTIKCEITLPNEKGGITINAEKTFSFSSQGTSGTDYTIVVKAYDGRPFGFGAPNPNPNAENTIIETINLDDFSAELYDINGEKVKEIEVDWLHPPYTLDNEYHSYDYNVLKAEAKNITWAGRDTTLIAYYPITFSRGYKYYSSIPSKIIYDSFGKLKTNRTMEVKLFDVDTNQEVKDAVWDVFYFYLNSNGELQRDYFQTVVNLSSLPRKNDNKLELPVLYPNSRYFASVVFWKKPKTEAEEKNPIRLWSQPLIIQQYTYGSEILNDWDGKLQVDNAGNRILSAAAAFGSMNTNNQFSGVVLGKADTILEGSICQKHGLYGYQDGAQSFGFRDDGTAFIGKSGTGRIEFDGENGVIQSAFYDHDSTQKFGSKWNLQNGSLIMYGGTNGNYFKFNEDNDGKLKLKLSGADILLTDKNNTDISTHIEATSAGIISTVTDLSAKVQFYGVCDTDPNTQLKVVKISEVDQKNFPLHKNELYPTGTTISVKFTKGNKISGATLLQIEHLSSGSPNLYDNDNGENIVLAGKKQTPILAAGDTVIFVYDASIDGNNMGAWVIADGGASSQIKQTAEGINASVSETYLTKEGHNATKTFGWHLDVDGFYIGKTENPNSTNYVFKVDSNGNGAFKGDLNVADRFKISAAEGINFGNVFQVDNFGQMALYTTRDVSQHTGWTDSEPNALKKVITVSNPAGFPKIKNDMYPTGTIIKVKFNKGNTKTDGIKFVIQGTGETGYEDVVADLYGSIDTSPVIEKGGERCFRYNQKAGNGNGAWELITEGNKNQVFRVNRDELWFDGDGTFSGDISAAKGTFKGGIEALGLKASPTETEIGGFTITAKGIYAGTAENPTFFIYKDSSSGFTVNGNSGPWRLWAGPSANSKAGNFGVTTAGKLYATGAVISGEITATEGQIGPLKIQTGSIGIFDSTNPYANTYITHDYIRTNLLYAKSWLFDSYGVEAYEGYGSQAIYMAANSYGTAVSIGPAGFCFYEYGNTGPIKTISWQKIINSLG